MTKDEQAAFVDAFGSSVSGVDDVIVADFVRRYSNGEYVDYSSDYTPIMDALCMWHCALRWKLQEMKNEKV